MNPYPFQPQAPAPPPGPSLGGFAPQPPRTTPTPSQDDRLMAAVAHLSFFVGFWLVGPIVFYVIKRKESPFVAFHAMQALVAHVLSTAFAVAGAVAFFVCMGLAGLAAHHDPAALVTVLVLALALGALYLGLAVVNAVAAYKAWVGEAWPIPIAGRIARGIIGADTGASSA